MTFNQLVDSFERAGMDGQYLVMPDGSYIEETVFGIMFEADYDPTKVYTSLCSNPNTTEGWKAIWDDMKVKGLIN